MFEKPKIECTNCKFTGSAKLFTPGSLAIEIVLWLCFLIPGLIYSLWRHSVRYWGCPECGWKYVRRLKGDQSPGGKMLRAY